LDLLTPFKSALYTFASSAKFGYVFIIVITSRSSAGHTYDKRSETTIDIVSKMDKSFKPVNLKDWQNRLIARLDHLIFGCMSVAGSLYK